MTKAFLEPIVLKVENESLVRKAFSKESMDKVKAASKPKQGFIAPPESQKLAISQIV